MPRRAGIALLAGAAAAISGYLAYTALIRGALPVGCGSGSGCGAVLSSPWSRVLDLPVSLPACLLYAALCVTAMLPARPRLLRLGVGAAGAILGTALWFTALQAILLRAFCVYCMTDHALGLALAVLLWRRAGGYAGRGRAFAIGLGLAGALAVAQVAQPRPVATLDVSAQGDFDRVGDGGREVGVFGGRLRLEVAAEPRFGSDDAETVVAVMFDYACPHCRNVHRTCRALVDRGAPLLVLALPTPIAAACNPHMRDTAERFRESCELARLALAVHYADPAAWPAFDAWLFADTTPRTAAQTHARAAEALGARLPAALADPRVERTLRRNVDAFGAIPVDDPDARLVPVTWSPGRPPLVGPIASPNAFLDWLRRAPETNELPPDA